MSLLSFLSQVAWVGLTHTHFHMWTLTGPFPLAKELVQGWECNPIRLKDLIEDICWDSKKKELLYYLKVKNQSFFSGWHVRNVSSRTTGEVFWCLEGRDRAAVLNITPFMKEKTGQATRNDAFNDII